MALKVRTQQTPTQLRREADAYENPIFLECQRARFGREAANLWLCRAEILREIADELETRARRRSGRRGGQ